MDAETLKEVRQLSLFANLVDESLDCIRPGEVISLKPGEILHEQGTPADAFFVTMEGEVLVTKTYDNQEVVLGTSTPGMFMGEISLLLDTPWEALVRASKPSRLFRLEADDFWKMMSTCHAVAREILRTAATRFRNLEGYNQQREKLISLGNMAAGLAHELNNPASAARRATAHLQESVLQAQASICALSKAITPTLWKHLAEGMQQALQKAAHAEALDSIARSDKEETLAGWLEQQRVEEAWKVAPALVMAGLDSDWLKGFLSGLPEGAASAAISWLEANLVLKALTRELEQSTTRISELVRAVKSYSYMDQPAKQELDVHGGLDDTLAIMGHKLKGINIVRNYDRSLPKITAHGGELNQVWTNLIDNAVGALNGAGTITITTGMQGHQIVVEIADNGSGIPEEAQSRIFEPFFTTKGVGRGTGLGLVISHRIVADRHGGEIEFESKPGDTRFRVRLPLRPKNPTTTPAAS